MSNMQQMSYLQNLVSQANKLKIEQENRQRELAMTYETKVRQANMSNRARQAALSTSKQKTLIPRKKPLVEPDLAYTQESVRGIGALYEQAKTYDPFATTKTETQLKEPLTFFDTLSKKVSTGYLEQQKPLIDQREAIIQKRDAVLKNIPSTVGGSRRSGSGYSRTSNPNPTYTNIYNSYKKQLDPIEQQISRLGEINQNVYLNQQQTLANLIAEQEKYYGKDFSNVDKNILSVADWSGWQSLTGDIAKYTSLRDSYINRYKSSGSKVDMDWIKQYNDLISSTLTSMSSEVPKTLTAAQKAAGTLQSTATSTLSTLESLNKAFGERGKSTIKPTLEQRKVIDVSGVDTTRQQVIARMNRVGSYLDQSKPAPKFESRPV